MQLKFSLGLRLKLKITFIVALQIIQAIKVAYMCCEANGVV